MSSNYTGIITSFESNDILKNLTTDCGVSTVSIAGKYRAIDFPLSFMKNARIRTVCVFSNNNHRSLRNHLEFSKSWEFSRKNGGLFIEITDKKIDTEIISENFDKILKSKDEMVVLAPAHVIANVDLERAMNFHDLSDADVTVIYKNINENTERFLGCDALAFNEKNSLTRVQGNYFPKSNQNISLEIFLIKKSLLLSLIMSKPSKDISLKNIIYRSKNNLNIMGFEHKGYLSILNSLSNYYNTNLEMTNSEILREIFFNENRPIFSKVQDSMPTHYSEDSIVKNSIISNECSIKGTVLNSVLSRCVTVEEGATVENCIIFHNCTIKSGAKLKNVIVDKWVTLDGENLDGSPFYPLVIQSQYKF